MDLGRLTRDEVRAAASNAVFVLPVGAVEQHGPHMPIATDIIFSNLLCEEAADMASAQASVFVSPPQPFGISNHHKPHPGVFSLSAPMFCDLLSTLLTSAFESGFRRAAIVNAHNGNDEAIRIVARELNNNLPLTIGATSYWSASWQHLEKAGVVDRVARIPGHAGTFETALMLALRPELVQVDRIPQKLAAPANARPTVAPMIFAARSNHGHGPGYSDDPAAATKELGVAIRNACVKGLSEFFVKLHGYPLKE